MNITVKKEVFSKLHPHLKIAVLAVKSFKNIQKMEESKHLLQEAEQMIRLSFNKDSIKTHQLISPWAVAQQEFGKEAKHYHTSVERLLKKVLKNKKVAVDNTLTNIINYLSLKHIIPMSVDDLSKINGDLTFGVATGKENVSLLKKLRAGALYYHDNKNLLGMKLDYWKNKKTVLTKNSCSALIHIEALPPVNNKELRAIAKETADLVSSFCGGRVKIVVLDKKKNTTNI